MLVLIVIFYHDYADTADDVYDDGEVTLILFNQMADCVLQAQVTRMWAFEYKYQLTVHTPAL